MKKSRLLYIFLSSCILFLSFASSSQAEECIQNGGGIKKIIHLNLKEAKNCRFILSYPHYQKTPTVPAYLELTSDNPRTFGTTEIEACITDKPSAISLYPYNGYISVKDTKKITLTKDCEVNLEK